MSVADCFGNRRNWRPCGLSCRPWPRRNSMNWWFSICRWPICTGGTGASTAATCPTPKAPTAPSTCRAATPCWPSSRSFGAECTESNSWPWPRWPATPFPTPPTSFSAILRRRSSRPPAIAFPFLHPFATMKKEDVVLLGQGLPLELTFSCIAPSDGLALRPLQQMRRTQPRLSDS